MIFQLLQDYSFSILTAVLGLFPDADSSWITTLTHATDQFKNYFDAFNWFFPVNDFFVIFTFVLVCESLMFFFKATRWILSIVTIGTVK